MKKVLYIGTFLLCALLGLAMAFVLTGCTQAGLGGANEGAAEDGARVIGDGPAEATTLADMNYEYRMGGPNVFRYFFRDSFFQAEAISYARRGFLNKAQLNLQPQDRKNILFGDFNGDGKHDVLNWWVDFGNWSADFYSYNDTSFYVSGLVRQQGTYWKEQTYLTGDFNGDGKTDVMKWWPDGENEWTADVHLSTGTGFTMSRWADNLGLLWKEQQWLTGDFNGDGKTDIMKWWAWNGEWEADVYVSTGSSFIIQRWGSYTDRLGWVWPEQHYQVGDFNQDGKDDIVRWWNDGGAWTADVLRSDGTRFYMDRWATRLAADDLFKNTNNPVLYLTPNKNLRNDKRYICFKPVQTQGRWEFIEDGYGDDDRTYFGTHNGRNYKMWFNSTFINFVYLLDSGSNYDRSYEKYDINTLELSSVSHKDFVGSLYPLRRLWNPVTRDHAYNMDVGQGGMDNSIMLASGYVSEGFEGMIFYNEYGTYIPLYHYWNELNTDHFYTTDYNELRRGAFDYKYLGIAGYVLGSQESDSIPLYRYWSAYEGDHFYTTKPYEMGTTVKGEITYNGYICEGIACYVLPMTE